MGGGAGRGEDFARAVIGRAFSLDGVGSAEDEEVAEGPRDKMPVPLLFPFPFASSGLSNTSTTRLMLATTFSGTTALDVLRSDEDPAPLLEVEDVGDAGLRTVSANVMPKFSSGPTACCGLYVVSARICG